MPAPTDPNVLVGTATADDGAVYRLSPELALVQSLDFFTPVVDDPYWYGQIAAANSLSDIYAMGGRPLMAMNVVAFPRNNPDVPLSVLGRILAGGAAKAREANIEIVGGHSIDDPEPKYGLVVTGLVEPGFHWTNVGARPGDRLVLTKPLGVGIVTTGLKRGVVEPALEQAALETMAALNRVPSEVARAVGGISACTDVTGFGFLGHLSEMLGQARLGVRVEWPAVPVLSGVTELAQDGVVPGGTRRNLEAVADRVHFDPGITEVQRLILADAQTSGGLLLAVHPDRADALCRELEAVKLTAALVGTFTDADRGIHVVGA